MSFIPEFFIANLSLIKIQIFVFDLSVYTKWSYFLVGGEFSIDVLFLMARMFVIFINYVYLLRLRSMVITVLR